MAAAKNPTNSSSSELLVERFVCTACRGVYFAPVNNVCPGCKAPMEVKLVRYDAGGVAHVETD